MKHSLLCRIFGHKWRTVRSLLAPRVAVSAFARAAELWHWPEPPSLLGISSLRSTRRWTGVSVSVSPTSVAVGM